MESLSEVINDSTRGGFYLAAASVLAIVFSTLSVLVIARILGSELYGLYSLTMVAPTLITLFTNLGINQGLMKFSASYLAKGEKNRLRKLMFQSFSIVTILGVIGSLVCFVFSNQFASYILHRPEISGFVQLTSVLVILQVIFDVTTSAFIGVNKTEYTAIVTIVQSLVYLLLGPALVLSGLSVTGVLIGYVFSYVVASSLGLYLLISKVYKPLKQSENELAVSHSDFKRSDFKTLIYFGLPLYFSVMITGFDGQFRTILLAMFTSNYELGNFQAAANFGVFIGALTGPINKILLPAFAKLENKKDSVKEFFRISIKYTSLIMLPIIMFVMVYAEEIVSILYGVGYELTPEYLVLLFSTYFLMGLGLFILRSLFNGLGNTKISLGMTLISTIVLIVLSPALMVYIGVTGLLITLIISAVVSTLFGLYIAKRKFAVNIGEAAVSRIYFVAFVSAIPAFLIKQIPLYHNLINFAVGAALFLITYLVILPKIEAVSLKELEEIKEVVKKIRLLKYIAIPIIIFEEKLLLYRRKIGQ